MRWVESEIENLFTMVFAMSRVMSVKRVTEIEYVDEQCDISVMCGWNLKMSNIVTVFGKNIS